MLSTIVLLAVGGAGLVSAQSNIRINAVEPTKSGQIGVNPVSIYPEESYHILHAHTQYWDQEPTTTKWIGVNTEMLTDLPYVTTIDNKPIVTTAPANIAASIIASPTDGAAVGDIAITFSEKLSNVLNEIAAEVEAIPCGRRKRMVCEARASEFAHHVADELESGGRLAFVADNPTVLVSASDVAAIVSFVTNTRASAIVSLAVTSYLISKVPAKLPSVFKLMKDMAITGGTGSDVQSCPPFELGCDGCKGNTLGTCVFPWAGCPCKKTEQCPDPNPKCDDDKCQGDSDNFCTNENKGCACEPSEEEGKCPEEVEDYPDCDECGGNTGDFKCKEEYNGVKDCGCNEFPPVGVKPLKDTVDYKLAQSLMDDFVPTISLDDPKYRPKCEGEDEHSSTLPFNVFFDPSKDTGVFYGFCDEMDNGKLDQLNNQEWTVNAKGEHQTRKRTPPPNPDAWKQQIKLKWAPNKNNHQCGTTCKDVFKNIAQSGCGHKGGQQNEMSVRASEDINCGTYSYEITGDQVPIPKPAQPTCLKREYAAPQRDGDVKSGATSVESAFRKWCSDIDGKTVEKQPGIDTMFARWGFADYDVPDRHSFWLRASYSPVGDCGDKGQVSKDDCINVLNSGMAFCDANSGGTHGLTGQGKNCVEYSIDISDGMHDGSPPWNENVVAFPPPEKAQSGYGDFLPVEINCKSTGSGVKLDDVNAAIDEFCSSDGPYGGRNVNVQKKNLRIDAIIDFGFSHPTPYKDNNWCNGWDKSKKSKDDCTYAFRKMLGTCNKGIDNTGNYKFRSASWYYRCALFEM